MNYNEATKEDKIICMMEELNKFIDKIKKGNLKLNIIEQNNELYEYYFKQINSIQDYYKYDEIFKLIYNSKYLDLYIETLKNIKLEEMYYSNVHGLSHVLRTSLFGLLISTIENLNEHEFKLLLTSIIYHDIGRKNDLDDVTHGYNSAKKIKFLKEEIDENDLNIIEKIVICHCLEDDEYEDIYNSKNINDKEIIKKLLFIIKDADALDRVRETPYCDVKYLRYDVSKKLLPFACILFNSYISIKE